MRAPVAVFLAATLAGALAVLAVADANGAAFVVTIAVAGVVVATIGGALGRSQVVCAGAAVLLGAYGSALAAGSPTAVHTLVVAVLVWLHLEAHLLSIDLRPAYRPTGRAWVTRASGAALVSLATLFLWLLAGMLERDAPAGGLTFRLTALGAVVVVAVLVSGLPWRDMPGSGQDPT
ncbi:MAG: hypothetical protein DIU67_010575 [Actinomycetes bacterium]|jgi:hypothetical protein|nr:MAG: hypothetical protein DIU67_08845 [Actinomycetota bacterium]